MFAIGQKYAYKGKNDKPEQSVNPNKQNYNEYNTESFLRKPTINNPMMNIPMYDYDRKEQYSDYDRYDKYRDSQGQVVKNAAEEDLSNGIFKDPADYFFKKNSSERQFFSVPIGGNAADTVEFAENLYGNKYVCKSGSIYMNSGVLYTDDSLHCTPGQQVPRLTGFGNIN